MTFTAPARPIERVFLHCSASDHPDHDDVAVMRDWHVNGNGWSDVGYHYFIKKDGRLQSGRDLERTPAAQAGQNTGTIAICLHGLAKHRFTEKQFHTLVGLCKEIHTAYEGQVTFHGHAEVANKSCPVFDYRRVLGLGAGGEMMLAADPAPSTTSDEVDLTPTLPVLRVTDRGDAVVLLQRLLGDASPDGVFGRSTREAVTKYQEAHGLTVDGVVGPATWLALAPA